MLTRDILGTKGTVLHTAQPDDTAAEAVHRMVELDIGSLLVMEGERLAGIFTARDILKAIDLCRCDLTTVKVGEIMSREVITGRPDDTVDTVRETMTRHHISHLPIVEDRRVVGLISFYDVARASLKQTRFENELLKRYIKNWPEGQEEKAS